MLEHVSIFNTMETDFYLFCDFFIDGPGSVQSWSWERGLVQHDQFKEEERKERLLSDN